MRGLPTRKPGFELGEFEYLSASAESVLLRVAGRWTRDPGSCELVAKTGAGSLTLDALPQPPNSGDTWRAAFSAAPALVKRDDVRFQLVSSKGSRARLPRPAEHSARATAPRRAPRRFSRSERPPRRSTGAERERFLALLESAGEQRERLERALREERERAQRLRVDLDATLELAEDRLAALRTTGRKLGRVRARIDNEVATRTAAARASERRALDEVARLRGRVAQLEGIVGRLVVGVEEGEKRLAEAEARGLDLRVAIDRAQRERPEAPQIAAIRESLDRRLERIIHLERQAKALQAAIHGRLDTAPRDPGQEQLFDAPVEQTPVPA